MDNDALLKLVKHVKKTLLFPKNSSIFRKWNRKVVCNLNEKIEKGKISLQEEILSHLNTALRLLLAIEKAEVYSTDMAKPLIHLTHFIDKISEFSFLLNENLSYRELKKVNNKLYNLLKKMNSLLSELLNVLPEKEKVIEFYNDEKWSHLNSLKEESPFFLPQSLARDVMATWRNKAEAVLISIDMGLSSILEKQPLEWLDAIATFLHLHEKNKSKQTYVKAITEFLKQPSNLAQIISHLPLECQGLLRLVLEAGGSFPYACLIRYFGNDLHDGFYWQIKPPKSTIGMVRTRGLLFVGNMERMGTLTKVAFIPKDLRFMLHHLTATPGNILRLPE